jgi:serine/threonine protein kinase
VLGQGGMGIVFKAEDSQLERPVSLKVIKPARLDDSARVRFLREAKAMAAVKHDHIVTVYQVGQEGDVPFLAMEFLSGEMLEHWLQRGKRPSLTQALRIGREIALGLAAAHDAGLIHRDIKPGNIWLESPRGRVKILDFGLARPQLDNTALTRLGDVLGTPAYMAPEQAQGKPVDHRCDMFSLGCVLYRMLTGRAPFREKSVQETLLAVIMNEPPPPIQLNAAIPQGLSDLVMALLIKNPEQRPTSAKAIAESLRKFAAPSSSSVSASGSAPVQSTTPKRARPAEKSEPRRPDRPRPRSAWLVIGIIGAVGALLLMAAVIWLVVAKPWQARPVGEPPPRTGKEDVKPSPPDDPKPKQPAKPQIVVEKPPPEEWISLFNGKDTSAWKIHPDKKLRYGWKVEDGLLIAEQIIAKKKKGTPTPLYSDLGDFDDFHVRIEAKINDTGKMMLYYRVPFADVAKFSARAVYLGSAPYQTGRLLGFAPPADVARPDEWFTLELIANGRSIHVKVNGLTTAETEDAVFPPVQGHFVFAAVANAETTLHIRKIDVRRMASKKNLDEP